MDPTVQIAFLGIVTAIITTAGAVIVGIVNGKKEKVGAAENTMEAVLRERISLRDEQIAELKKDLAERDTLLARLQEELALWEEGGLPRDAQ